MKSVDVKSIVKEVRSDIKRAGFSNSDLDLDDARNYCGIDEEDLLFDEDDLLECLSFLSDNQNIAWDRPLSGGVKGFAQKVVRKLGKFMIVHFVEDQNRYNQQVERCLELLAAAHFEQQRSLRECEKSLEALEEQVNQALAKRP